MNCRRIEYPAGVLLLLALVSCGTSEPPRAKTAPAKPEPAATRPVKPKITQFYAGSGRVEAGKDVTICYGVENAERVAIEPPVERLKPARNRCFSITPKKSGVYELTATGSGGTATAQLAIQVVPPERAKETAGLITTFLASATSVRKGSPVTLCYTVNGAESVRIEPPVAELATESRCFSVQLDKTTKFTITAAAGKRTDQRSLTVAVR